MSVDKRIDNWLSDDGIHLNSEGHFWIYQRLKGWEILKRWKDS